MSDQFNELIDVLNEEADNKIDEDDIEEADDEGEYDQEGDDIVSETTTMANNKIMSLKDLNNITLQEADGVTPSIDKVIRLKPVKTRRNMSKFEFAGVITKLAFYLSTLDSLDMYVDDIVIPEFVNNAELAYHLLMNGKFNAIINRLGYEQVSFSELRINPIWKITLENYFNRNRRALYENCYKPIDKVLREDKKE